MDSSAVLETINQLITDKQSEISRLIQTRDILTGDESRDPFGTYHGSPGKTKARRKFSAATLAKMRASQAARWAKVHKEQKAKKAAIAARMEAMRAARTSKKVTVITKKAAKSAKKTPPRRPGRPAKTVVAASA